MSPVLSGYEQDPSGVEISAKEAGSREARNLSPVRIVPEIVGRVGVRSPTGCSG